MQGQRDIISMRLVKFVFVEHVYHRLHVVSRVQ